MVVVAGLHLLQTAFYGAYKKPRELNWIVGVAMLGLILAFALTGYLLPWDQTGYWATKVATSIAGTSPVIGEQLQAAIQGGNEYGNLTLTRFYALHVLVLPAALITLTVVHIYLFRRHQQTPHARLSQRELEERVQPFWPNQMIKDVIAMAATFAALIGINVATGGAGLDAPADPASNFDARPEWYFRPLFQLLKYFEGPMETVVALGLPVVVGGVLIAMPFLDRGPDRAARKRIAFLAVLLAGFVATGALTAISMLEDSGDEQIQKRLAEAEEQAARARELARTRGVPAAGGYAVLAAGGGEAALALWNAECATCHQGSDRASPEIGPGYNSREWIRAFLLDPAGDRFFGRTGIDKMKPVELEGADLDAIVELVYAQTGAPDARAELVARGQELFDDGDCSNCHEIDGKTDGIGPNLADRGSPAWLADFIALPEKATHFGDLNEMPAFYDKLGPEERRALAELIGGWRDAP
jgi:ubiquinol-cytochrome c reductase cytochrome b subunit